MVTLILWIFQVFSQQTMKFKVSDVIISVSYPAVAFCTLAIISAPDNKVLMCLFSALCHECGHLVAMKLYGVSVKEISVSLGDIAINTDESANSFTADVIITLSGVAVNFILFILFLLVWFLSEAYLFRDLAVANLCIGFFNILPISSVDGGNLLLLVLERHCSLNVSQKVISAVTAVFLIPLLVAGFLMLFAAKNNFSLLFAALYLLYIFVSKEIR